MRTHPTPVSGAGHARGSSLLEVLIAVLVLAVGMLGMAALQAVTLKNTNSSAARSQAAIQSYSMLDMLRMNRQAALAGSYNVPGWACTTAAADPDDPGDTTDYSVFNTWLSDVQGALGGEPCGRVACAGDGMCTVGVRWDDSRGTGDEQEPLEYEIISRL